MAIDPVNVRYQVLRRVNFAFNYLAVEAGQARAEAPFDAALTNGLLAIVADEWPGAEEKQFKNGTKTLPASELLTLIDAHGGLPGVDVPKLKDALEVSQPHRHGRADDEFEGIGKSHIDALRSLDEHAALRFIDDARGLTWDKAVVRAYEDRASEELPFDPKERSMVPEPTFCDSCGRETFIQQGWDDFGGDDTAGACIACGYEVSDDVAYERAVARAIWERVHDGK